MIEARKKITLDDALAGIVPSNRPVEEKAPQSGIDLSVLTRVKQAKLIKTDGQPLPSPIEPFIIPGKEEKLTMKKALAGIKRA